MEFSSQRIGFGVFSSSVWEDFNVHDVYDCINECLNNVRKEEMHILRNLTTKSQSLGREQLLTRLIYRDLLYGEFTLRCFIAPTSMKHGEFAVQLSKPSIVECTVYI